jgi:hypothetical protein
LPRHDSRRVQGGHLAPVATSGRLAVVLGESESLSPPLRDRSGGHENPASGHRGAKMCGDIGPIQARLGTFPLGKFANIRPGVFQPVRGNAMVPGPYEFEHALAVRPQRECPELAAEQEPLERVGESPGSRGELGFNTRVQPSKPPRAPPPGGASKKRRGVEDRPVRGLGDEVPGAAEDNHVRTVSDSRHVGRRISRL